MTNRTSRDNQRSEAVVVDAVALGTGSWLVGRRAVCHSQIAILI
jgi:hypothetical protein